MTGHNDSVLVHRLEVVNTGRRRRWSLDEKLRIVAESYEGHRQVSAVARRHNLSRYSFMPGAERWVVSVVTLMRCLAFRGR